MGSCGMILIRQRLHSSYRLEYVTLSLSTSEVALRPVEGINNEREKVAKGPKNRI